MPGHMPGLACCYRLAARSVRRGRTHVSQHLTVSPRDLPRQTDETGLELSATACDNESCAPSCHDPSTRAVNCVSPMRYFGLHWSVQMV